MKLFMIFDHGKNKYVTSSTYDVGRPFVSFTEGRAKARRTREINNSRRIMRQADCLSPAMVDAIADRFEIEVVETRYHHNE